LRESKALYDNVGGKLYIESQIKIDLQKEGALTEAYKLTHKQMRYLKIKRMMDFVISIILLMILIIPFLLIAILQKIDNPGEPVFFHQMRVGLDGSLFYITKFRSMKSNVPKYIATKNLKNDDICISKWGHFLRESSLDELPQLIQVLTGKMSLIGPRPLIPQEREIHHFRKYSGVYQLRPGITGWAQVNGRDLITDAEKGNYDLEYMRNISFSLDLKIFCLTIVKVCKHADIQEGIQKTQHDLVPSTTVIKEISDNNFARKII